MQYITDCHKKSCSSQQEERRKKIIFQAKQLLMQYQDMTEPEAHRFLQKQAMNLRLTKKCIAESIINYYTKTDETTQF
jgi:response regulator NasT